MADIFTNLQSGTLTADPGSGGTTLSSAAFANLPTIAAPDTMRLTLDPDGALGLPEIVLITAHTAAATSCTVTRGQEIGFGGNAGLGHAIGTVWRHSLTRADLEELPYRKVTTKGDILVASADKTISRVAAGANTTQLVADSSQANGVRWAPETELNLIDAKGDVVTGSADNTLAKTTVGANDTRLVADSAQTGGVRWAADTELKLVNAKGDLIVATADNVVATFTVGANDTRLVADSSQASGLRYAPDTELKLIAAKGDLLAGTANDTIAVLTAGANDRRLVADSTQATGLRYAPDTELKLVDAKGDLLTGTADNTIARLAVANDKAFLMADSASAGGVKWNTGALPVYAPTISQGGVVTYGGNGFTTRNGRAVTVEFILTVIGSGSASTLISLDLPVAADAAGVSDFGSHGTIYFYDSSANSSYNYIVTLATTTAVKFRINTTNITGAIFAGTGSFTAGLGNNDIISGAFTYPAAAD